jgi:DNA-directed RNA polymerase beta' subunit
MLTKYISLNTSMSSLDKKYLEHAKPIEKIDFPILSDIIPRRSALHDNIDIPELYDGVNFHDDKKKIRCNTCGLTIYECSGHFGYIELHEPIFSKVYLLKLLNDN